MPHVIVKMYSGKTNEQKRRLADAVTKAVTSTLGYGDESVSVAIEDVAPSEWRARVYDPDIAGRPELLFKKPGYTPR